VLPGEIHRHRHFYLDRDTGEFRGKYLLTLAALPSGDLVVRVLTSRPHGRPMEPPCYHGDPYPGFYLGILGGQLQRASWLDLRASDDVDTNDVNKEESRGDLSLVMALNNNLFRQALNCAASANDTTRLQERAIRDLMATLP
jgi:hypothetical protein